MDLLLWYQNPEEDKGDFLFKGTEQLKPETNEREEYSDLLFDLDQKAKEIYTSNGITYKLTNEKIIVKSHTEFVDSSGRKMPYVLVIDKENLTSKDLNSTIKEIFFQNGINVVRIPFGREDINYILNKLSKKKSILDFL